MRVMENSVVVSLSATAAGSRKTSKKVATSAAAVLDMHPDATVGGILLWDDSIDKAIRKPLTKARTYMKEMTVPWSVSRNNDNGGRVSDNEYLLPAAKLVEFEREMTSFRMEREAAMQKFLFNNWDMIRQEAKTRLNDQFDERHFPSLSELRNRFTWEVSVKPLWDIKDVADDVRLKASQDIIDRAIADAERAQSRRITNAMSSIVEDLVSETTTIIEGIDSYEHNEIDRRKGNTLPKGRGWANLDRQADRLDTWADSFEAEGLSDTADKIRELVKNISDIGGGDVSNAREAMGGSDDTLRKEVREKLVDISRTAEKTMSSFDKFMS